MQVDALLHTCGYRFIFFALTPPILNLPLLRHSLHSRGNQDSTVLKEPFSSNVQITSFVQPASQTPKPLQ